MLLAALKYQIKAADAVKNKQKKKQVSRADSKSVDSES